MKDRILKVLIFVILGVGFFLAALCIPAHLNTNTKEYIATVINKEIKTYLRSQGFLFNVTLQNGENRVLSVQDSIPLWRFNSKDVYNEIKVGKTYKFVVVGLYEPALYLYENILEMTEEE